MGQKIDEALIRKRSEHNDGEISTLKEITLHQFDIEKIENLDVYCKQLEILFLQSNQISKIENLSKLKSLKYLQLALNNIKKIENLSGCESLEKLDLTVNFIDDLLSVESLKENIHLKQLYLVGNPCTGIDGYRHFVIATLPQLQTLDGKDIEKSERIIAMQEHKAIRERLVSKSMESLSLDTENNPEKDDQKESDQVASNMERDLDDIEKKRQEFQTKPVKHTPESRLQTAKELEILRSKEKKHLEKKKEEKKKVYYGSDGRVLQCNEGKYQYKWNETPEVIQLTVEISKFLDTSFIDVDVHPDHVIVTIKGKILRLLFDEPVKSSSVVCERSRLTGDLVVTVEKEKKASKEGEKEQDIIDLVKKTKTPLNSVVSKQSSADSTKSVSQKKKSEFDPTKTSVVDYRNIINNNKTAAAKKISEKKQRLVGGIVELDGAIKSVEDNGDFVDDPDVPPLC